MADLGAATVAEPRTHEVIVELIAGPETAARLGVPVGTVVEARHARTAVDGSFTEGGIVTPEEAAVIKQDWRAE